MSAWNARLEGANQQDLIVTQHNEPKITTDSLEVAQFIYLLLNSAKIRDVIDTVGKKGILLLGAFSDGRLAILHRLQEELRARGYVAMVFDFDKPDSKTFTETVQLLAGLSRFVIVDLTNPRSSPLELQALVPNCIVPFIPIIEDGAEPFSMFKDLAMRDNVLGIQSFGSVDELIEKLDDKIIGPALKKSEELLSRKNNAMTITRL